MKLSTSTAKISIPDARTSVRSVVDELYDDVAMLKGAVHKTEDTLKDTIDCVNDIQSDMKNEKARVSSVGELYNTVSLELYELRAKYSLLVKILVTGAVIEGAAIIGLLIAA